MSHVTCHMSRVMCHVSRVTCHVSRVTCHVSSVTFFFLFFFFLYPKKNYLRGGASQWRVCYQRGLPRLVSWCEACRLMNLCGEAVKLMNECCEDVSLINSYCETASWISICYQAGSLKIYAVRFWPDQIIWWSCHLVIKIPHTGVTESLDLCEE